MAGRTVNVDVIVVGGGIVGASFALQLANTALQVAIVDHAARTNVALDGDFDHRVYALTPTNVATLDQLGVFQSADRARLTPIRSMEIFGDKGAKLTFSARDARCDELALMVEHRLLAQRLIEKLFGAPNVQYFSQSRPNSLRIEDDVSLALDDGTTLNGSLLVGADGVNSWVRNEAGFSVSEKNYEQIALVANFRCEKNHGQVARQWFANSSVLAWLPLGEEIISIVWSVPRARARELAALAGDEFCHGVANAGANALGAMHLVSAVAQFPLGSLRSDRLTKRRVALIGDAGHGIHPLAGQGLNLGLHDAAALAQMLRQRSGPEGVGDLTVLRRYERSRKEELARMHYITDGLQGLFAMESKVAAALRNSGLNLVNSQPWLKNMLIQHAIG